MRCTDEDDSLENTLKRRRSIFCVWKWSEIRDEWMKDWMNKWNELWHQLWHRHQHFVVVSGETRHERWVTDVHSDLMWFVSVEGTNIIQQQQDSCGANRLLYPIHSFGCCSRSFLFRVRMVFQVCDCECEGGGRWCVWLLVFFYFFLPSLQLNKTILTIFSSFVYVNGHHK